jgi:hypothetical protein
VRNGMANHREEDSFVGNLRWAAWSKSTSDAELSPQNENVLFEPGCSENISGFRLREKCFSLDIPLYRTSG